MKTLIVNGRLIDPQNRIDSTLNLLCEDGVITDICTDRPAADRVIDAAGLIVAPGFIDIHMHEDPLNASGTIDPCIFNCMLRMGVTTVVAGNCGDNTCDPVHYLDLCDRGVPVNVAMLAGHSWTRKAAGCTDKYAPATPQQREEIHRLLKEAVQAGCAGISFGVRYVPGTDREELIRAVSAAEGTNKLITAHVRDDAERVFSAIREMLDLTKTYRLPLQVSHIGSMAGFGQMNEVLRMLDAERANGADVMLDCYPYDAFSTSLGATTYDDGWLERYRCDYDALEFCEGEYAGVRANAKTFAKLRRERPDSLTVCHVMRPEEIRLAIAHPSVLIGSDGILDNGQGHPRAAGAFPRVFAEYVRSGALTLHEAIAKMTCLPAQRAGLSRKGTLSVGSDADIVLFDPESIRDRATFAEPILPPEGIRMVLIGGEIAAEHSKEVNTTLGRAVRVGKR